MVRLDLVLGVYDTKFVRLSAAIYNLSFLLQNISPVHLSNFSRLQASIFRSSFYITINFVMS